MTRGYVTKVVSSYGAAWGRIRAKGESREVFFNASDVTKKRDKLASQERGRFGGSSAVSGSSLGSSSAGSL